MAQAVDLEAVVVGAEAADGKPLFLKTLRASALWVRQQDASRVAALRACHAQVAQS